MSEEKKVFVGIIMSSNSLKNISVLNGYLCVEYGMITKLGPVEEFKKLQDRGTFSDFKIMQLNQDQFLTPGFVDCHTHAPQFPNIGLGLDRPLLEWLNKYTFHLEAKYDNIEFATQIYDQVVQRLLNNGTTTACYFGSLHLEGTLELVKSASKYRQRALVGKVSMNIKNDAKYYNNTKSELEDVEVFVQKVLELKNELVQPVVTPRFAISCDSELMDGLARISDKYACRIQSHISENRQEVEYVMQMFPECSSYADVYDKSRILNERCIMAHAVYLSEEEMALLSKKGVSVAHCPASNTRLKSGHCPVWKLVQHNINVGLGTDVSGGDSATMLDAMRRAMDVSLCQEMYENANLTITWIEAFYFATLGGAKALQLEDKIGSFEVGKQFDALLIDVYPKDGPIDKYEYSMDNDDHAGNLIQRFIFLGDDRNILQVYVKGDRVKDITKANS